MKTFFCVLLMAVIMSSCSPSSDSSETDVVFDEWMLLGPQEVADWESPQGSMSWEGDVLSVNSDEWARSAVSFGDFQWEMEVNAPGGGALGFRLSDQVDPYVVNLDFDSASLYPTGTIMQLARARILNNHQRDEWHKLLIQAQGTHLKVFINDTLVAQANDNVSLQGGLAIKSGDQPLRIRNQRVMPWEASQELSPLLEERYRADTTRSWQSFFQEDLSGWNPIGDAQWALQEGVLHGVCGEQTGWLVSESIYRNFYLITQFKIIKEDNSGIFIRKHVDSASVSLQDAIECNIYDHNGPQQAFGTGSIVFQARSWYQMIDYEGWNTMEIFAEDDHIVLFVNGIKSAEHYVSDPFNKSGQVALQAGTRVFTDNGPSNIYFKDLKIKSMD